MWPDLKVDLVLAIFMLDVDCLPPAQLRLIRLPVQNLTVQQSLVHIKYQSNLLTLIFLGQFNDLVRFHWQI